MASSSQLCSCDRQLKSPSDSSLITTCKVNKTSTEIKCDTERQNEDVFLSKLVSNEIACEKNPKSTDTLFEIPDMPSSAGSSFCRSTTSSSCSTQSTVFGEEFELQSSDTECDVCSSTLTLVSQSYAPSESTTPAMCCSIPLMDDTLLVILDSATAILQLPPSVTCCSTDCLVKKTFINTEKLLKSKESFSSSPVVEPLQPLSKSIMYPNEKNLTTETNLGNQEIMPRCKMRDCIQNQHHQTVPMYLVEMLPGQFMAFPTDMPGPLGPNPTNVSPQIELPLQLEHTLDRSQQSPPRLRQPIPLYHTIVESDKNQNEFKNNKKINNNKVTIT